MQDVIDKSKIDIVMRTLVTATRSLRLYPPASPMRRQSVEAVVSALKAVFDAGIDPLPLAVARDGFESSGEPVAVGVPGGAELAAELRAHGVSEIQFAATTSEDELLRMLGLLAEEPEAVRCEGGFGACMRSGGITSITVTEIQLVVVEGQTPEELRGGSGLGMGVGLAGSAEEVAGDPAQLSAWLSQAAAGDRSGLQTGLLSLIQAVGPHGTGDLAQSLSTAFAEQTTETRDVLLGLSMEPGPFRNLMGQMFRAQDPAEVAGAILGGSFGRNMLSLSNALTALPLDRLDGAVRDQVRSMLPGKGATAEQERFLSHMIDVRGRKEPERSLAASDQTYLAVAQAAAIKPDDLALARRALEASAAAIDAAGVRTMFTLLDQQTDLEAARASATNLLSMVARLLTTKQIALADYVLLELATRTDRVPPLSAYVAAARPEALGALIDATLADPETNFPFAQRIMQGLGEDAIPPFVAESIARKTDGLNLAERLFGRRFVEPLHNAVLHAQWFQLGPVVTRLALDGDSRSGATIEALLRRPDPQARKEIVNGLTAAGGQLAQKILGEIVSDPAAEVAIAAARALAKSGMPGSGAPIAARIGQLDIDNADFELGRELINALARTPDPAADELLNKLASRRGFMKRNHFNDVQSAVNAALQLRRREVATR